MSKAKKYILLIKKFVTGEIEVSTFEALYLHTFKNDAEVLSEMEYEVLNELFLDVDAFCGDPNLCNEDDIDEQQLLKSASEAVTKLAESNEKQTGCEPFPT